MEKLTCRNYKRDSFHGGYSTINLIMYNNKIVIPDKIPDYVVKWYHTRLIHSGIDLTEATFTNICTGLALDHTSRRK